MNGQRNEMNGLRVNKTFVPGLDPEEMASCFQTNLLREQFGDYHFD